MLKIYNAREFPCGTQEVVKYIHDKWGNEDNFTFYEDAINHSSLDVEKIIPEFYPIPTIANTPASSGGEISDATSHG